MQNQINKPNNNLKTKNIKMLTFSITASVFVFVFALLLLVYVSKKEKSTEQIFALNDTVTINNTFKTCVTDVSSSSSLSYTNSWGFPTSEHADNFFIIVKITIENIGKETCSLDESNFQLVMEGDYVYETHLLLSNTGSHDLAPLQKTNFTVVFDVVYSHTEKNYILKFYDSSWFSDNFSCNFRLY